MGLEPMTTCPFCKSDDIIPVTNSVGDTWCYCVNCKASGPHAKTHEDAEALFTIKKPTFIERLKGGKKA